MRHGGGLEREDLGLLAPHAAGRTHLTPKPQVRHRGDIPFHAQTLACHVVYDLVPALGQALHGEKACARLGDRKRVSPFDKPVEQEHVRPGGCASRGAHRAISSDSSNATPPGTWMVAEGARSSRPSAMCSTATKPAPSRSASHSVSTRSVGPSSDTRRSTWTRGRTTRAPRRRLVGDVPGRVRCAAVEGVDLAGDVGDATCVGREQLPATAVTCCPPLFVDLAVERQR